MSCPKIERVGYYNRDFQWLCGTRIMAQLTRFSFDADVCACIILVALVLLNDMCAA